MIILYIINRFSWRAELYATLDYSTSRVHFYIQCTQLITIHLSRRTCRKSRARLAVDYISRCGKCVLLYLQAYNIL